MIGLTGDDYYFIDHQQDVVIEKVDEGFDTIELKYCFWTNYNNLRPEFYTAPAHVEKIVMGRDEYDLVEVSADVQIRVYGDPIDWRDRMDDNQFDNASNLVNTCTMASIANVMTMLGKPVTEEEVLAYMLANNLVGIPDKGDTDPADVETALENGYGCVVTRTTVRPLAEVAEFLETGHAVILGVDYGVVNTNAEPRNIDDHAITLTGVAYHETSGEIEGFYYCDSGDEENPSGASFMSTNLYYEAHAQYPTAQILVIDSPLKIEHDSFQFKSTAGYNPAVIGNSGDNLIWTTHGNDYVEGGPGNDSLRDEAGGEDVFLPGAGTDVVSSFSGSDSFVFSAGDGRDEINDTDAEFDELVFDVSVERASIVFALAGSDLLVRYGSNSLVCVKDYSAEYGFSVRLADGGSLNPSGLSNLVAQMEAYCIGNSVDFTDPAAVEAEGNLVAMVAGSWQTDTNVIGYQVWAAMHGVGHELNGYAQSPAGDGVPNLIKYAAGLLPFDPVVSSDLFTFFNDSVSGHFKISYQRSKQANSSLVAEWSGSLTNEWQSAGIQMERIDESATHELWEASAPSGQSGFMRLRAVLNE